MQPAKTYPAPLTTTLYRECARSHMSQIDNVLNVQKRMPVNWHKGLLVERSPPVNGKDIVYGNATKKSETAMLRMRKSTARSG